MMELPIQFVFKRVDSVYTYNITWKAVPELDYPVSEKSLKL